MCLILNWFCRVESRKPERYSSAAPLSRKSYGSLVPSILDAYAHILYVYQVVTKYVLSGSADARLRIVSERVDLIDNLVISVSVSSVVATYLRLIFFAIFSCYVFYGSWSR